MQRLGIADIAERVIVGDVRLLKKIALANGIQFHRIEFWLLIQETGPVH